MKRFTLLTVVILTLFICLSGLAVAQDEKPDATLELSQGQVGLGIGFSWGSGTLTYQGKKYPVKVEGISVIDVGITKAKAAGKVYNLKKLLDFNGNYTAATAEGTLGGGAGATTMNNQNGVVINLVTTTQGINLKLAPSGVSLKLQ
ncbi:MAG: DUF1134 domain-containing protein [Syntrophales bacterium]